MSSTTETPGVQHNYQGTCATSGSAKDLVYRFVAPQTGTATVVLDPGSSFDAVLYARSACEGTQIGCRDSAGSAAVETLDLPTTQGGTYWLFVDGYSGQDGTFDLTVTY